MWYNEQTALEKNAARNRGSANDWFQHAGDYTDPSPKVRMRPEAQRIADRHTTSQIPFDPRAPLDAKLPPDGVPMPRVRGDDAAANVARHTDPPERWFDFEGNLQYAPDSRGPRCYGGAAKQVVDKMTNPVNQDWYKHQQFRPGEQPDEQPDRYQPGSTIQGKHIKEKMTKPSDWFSHQPAQSDAGVADADWRPPRTVGDGSDYAVRNIRGTSSDWMLSHDPNYADERPGRRLPSQQGNAIYNKNDGSGMKSCLTQNGEVQDDGDLPPQRISKSAEANYIRNRGLATQLMTGEVDLEPNLGTRNLVGQMANTIADQHRGQLGRVLDEANNADYAEEQPKPRVPSAVAQRQLERGRGTIDFADSSYRPPADDRKVHPRSLQTSALNAAEKHKGGSMQELMGNYQLDPSEQPAQRLVGRYAQQNATRNAGVGWSLLAHDSMAASEAASHKMPAAAQRVANRQAQNDISKTIYMVPPTDR